MELLAREGEPTGIVNGRLLVQETHGRLHLVDRRTVPLADSIRTKNAIKPPPVTHQDVLGLSRRDSRRGYGHVSAATQYHGLTRVLFGHSLQVSPGWQSNCQGIKSPLLYQLS